MSLAFQLYKIVDGREGCTGICLFLCISSGGVFFFIYLFFLYFFLGLSILLQNEEI